MDLIVCAYPLFLTYNFYDNPNIEHDLPFLVTWWSTFGTFELLENYAGLGNLPFYGIMKGGVLLTMYSNNYREWITKNALHGIGTLVTKGKTVGISIVDEHFPTLRQYINIPDNKTPEENQKTSNDNGWFGWFSRSNSKKE